VTVASVSDATYIDNISVKQITDGSLYVADDVHVYGTGYFTDMVITSNLTVGGVAVLTCADISALITTQSEHTVSIGNISNTVDGLTTSLGNVSNDLDTAEATLSGLVTSVGNISNDVDTAEGTLSGVVVSLGNVSNTVDGLTTSLGNVSNDLDTAESTLSGLVTSVGNISNDLDTAETDIGSLETHATTVSNTVDGLTTSVGNISNDLDTVEANYLSDGDTLSTGLYGPAPSVSNQYTTMQYVDNKLSTYGTFYLWGSTTSTIAGYYYLSPGLVSASNETTLTYTSPTQNQYLATFASPAGTPALTEMQAGTYEVVSYIAKVGAKAVSVKYEGYLLDENGVEKYEVDDTTTHALTTVKTRYSFDIVLPTNITTLVTDRWAIKCKVTSVGAPAPNVLIYTEGASQSYLTGTVGNGEEFDPIAQPQIDALVSTQTLVTTSLTTVSNTVDGITTSLGNVSNDLDTAETDIGNLETHATTVSNTVDGLTTSLTSVSNDLDTAEADIASIETHNTTVSNTVDGLTTSLTSVSNDLDTAEGTLSGLVTSVGNISNDLDTVEAAYIHKDGTVAMTGNFNLGGNLITNLADGVASGDAVNKGQLDAAVVSSLETNYYAINLMEPHNVQDIEDTVPLVNVSAYKWPDGITITRVGMGIVTASTYTAVFERWDSRADSGSAVSVHSLAAVAAAETNAAPTGTNLAPAGAWIMVDLPTTPINGVATFYMVFTPQ